MRITLLAGILLLIISSCDSSRLYEMNTDFSNRVWHTDSLLAFEVPVADGSEPVSLLLNLRNTPDYPYQRIFIGFWVKDSTDRVIHTNTLDLAGIDQFQLFERKTGKPLGSGLGDIFEHRFPLIENFSFGHEGNFTIEVQHYMRQEDLPGMVSAGIRIEKPEN